jgi:inosine-uridine nucleoside N-ribohydrolase
MTIAFLVNPTLCPVQPMHIRVDAQGFTRPDAGPPNAPNPPNAQVCLESNPDAFFRLLLPRLAAGEHWRGQTHWGIKNTTFPAFFTQDSN